MHAAEKRPGLDPAQVVVDAFRPVEDEVDAHLRCVEGAVPEGLSGVLYRNGVGRIEVHGTPQMHPFDGDGMVSRFALSQGQVHYRNRWVRTREFLEEERAGRMLYRGFGTNIPGGFFANAFRMRFKNAANTSVVYHGGKLLALWEAGQPHRLDPESLRTLERHDYGGALSNRDTLMGRIFAPEKPFSAHPKIDPRTGEMFNFGLVIGPRIELLVHRIDPRGELRETRRVRLDEPCFMHDFVLTERFAIFFATPIKFDLSRALSGLSTPVESIRRDRRRRTQIIVVPRVGGEPRRFDAQDGFFLFHYFNAYESGERLIIDGCRMEDFQGGTIDLRDPEAVRGAMFEPAFSTRWTVDLGSGEVRARRLHPMGMELPRIDDRFCTRAHRALYATARTRPDGPPLLNGLARLDPETGEAVVRDLFPDLPGEPVLLPGGPGEGQGWLASVVYRGASRRGELWLLDAQSLDTVARLEMPHHLPPGFHGSWVPSGCSAGSS
jgi:all-trans-8'-apo-beta-carotenal 15,15'-oxygenase